MCRGFGLLGRSVVALDGSRFKAVNNRDKNFTRAKLERWLRDTEESIASYMADLDRADREEDGASDKAERLAGRIDRLRARMAKLKEIEKQLEAAPDGQVSLTDPDARSMSTSAPGSGLVGYNVQAVVEPEHHLIVAHEVTNLGHDRAHLAAMAVKAKAEMAGEDLTVVADRGCFDGEEVMECEAAGVVPIVPKPDTSSGKADGRFSQSDFVYEPETDVYRCPAGERLTFRFETVEDGRTLRRYWASVCPTCPLKARCTPAPQRRISRWEHEAVLEAMPRGHARRHDDAPIDRRARLRHPEAVDGNGTLPHQGPEERRHRDEPLRPRLQPKTDDRHHGRRVARRRAEELR